MSIRNSTSDINHKEFKDENLIRTFNYVFDQSTIAAVHKLATRRSFEQIEFVISTGKEAHVFHAVDAGGEHRAVKVYKTAASTFLHMAPYMEGEKRFSDSKQDKRELVFEWVKKEFKNLESLYKAKVSAPVAYGYLENVLVMSLVENEEGEPAAALQDVDPKELEGNVVYEQLVDNLAKMIYGAKLIHADFSAYNVLWTGKKVVVIDVGQAVGFKHPRAREFLDRDFANVAKYAKRLGLEKTAEDVREDVKNRKP